FAWGDELSRRKPGTGRARSTTIREGTTMTQPSRRKGGLGRGLAWLIPPGPTDADGRPTSLGPRLGSAASDVVIGGPLPDAATMGAVYRGSAAGALGANP